MGVPSSVAAARTADAIEQSSGTSHRTVWPTKGTKSTACPVRCRDNIGLTGTDRDVMSLFFNRTQPICDCEIYWRELDCAFNDSDEIGVNACELCARARSEHE